MFALLLLFIISNLAFLLILLIFFIINRFLDDIGIFSFMPFFVLFKVISFFCFIFNFVGKIDKFDFGFLELLIKLLYNNCLTYFLSKVFSIFILL